MIGIMERIVRILAWFRIVASPLLLSLAIAGLVYLPYPTPARLVIAVIVISCGLITGIIWANHISRKTGTINFLSKIIATPELYPDQKPEDSKQVSE